MARFCSKVGCCGASGPNDYLVLKKPLPNECRDTVTGNAYFHGCSDEIVWFLEDKSSWLTGIAFTLGFLQRSDLEDEIRVYDRIWENLVAISSAAANAVS
ncbi:hypothetical protein V9T40_006584 [Parthenolecanium corni]|uniref:Uncharacterized protein n=1 Tax=Parthenolecanium corni TaxID=536013 RepID=A0AAN9TMJ6_9HEMI